MTIPFAAIEFTKDGTVAHQQQVDDALAMLVDERATDVLVISHGWNNDMPAARRWYDRVIARLAAMGATGTSQAEAARLAVIGVMWPSIRWADEDEVAGGGVSVGDDATALSGAIDAAVDDEAVAAQLRAAADELDSVDGRQRFVAAARELLRPHADRLTDDEDGAPSALLQGGSEEVFGAVRDAVVGEEGDLRAEAGAGDRAPGVAPDLLAGEGTAGAALFGLSWRSLGRRVLNTFTYYTMKARAGDVGTAGVAPLIDRINRQRDAPRVHLAGHSFGARVVSAAAAAADSPIASVTLLQGAFSHYGFTANYAGTGEDGAFRNVVTGGHLEGPLVITHTHNDKAVGLAYAIASRLARQTGAAIGGPSDLYGGIGANGSVGTQAQGSSMLDADGTYTLTDGAIHNLLADDHISGHSDVSNDAVVNVLAQAMRLR